MRVMVTGAGGMLGRSAVLACERRGHEVVALPRADLDITDGAVVDEAIRRREPEAVVNCAAWTDVDGAEDEEDAAMKVNDEAAALLAAAAADVGASVVYPSTDYVFDGRKEAPYVESDPTAPLSAYGRSKLAGETSVAVANRSHYIVRTAWLFGLGGPNFVETMLHLGEDRGEVLVVADQVGSPTYAGHLADAIARLVEGNRFGIHHLTAAGSCSRYEFAQEIFDQAGVDVRVMAAESEMLDRKASRPAYSVLGSERRDALELPTWRQGLTAYLAELKEERAREEAA